MAEPLTALEQIREDQAVGAALRWCLALTPEDVTVKRTTTSYIGRYVARTLDVVSYGVTPLEALENLRQKLEDRE
jgi:hypothetical protein